MRNNLKEIAKKFKPNIEYLLFDVVDKNGNKSYFYQYDKAIKYFEEYGVKIYVKTKDLFPLTMLLSWK